MVDIGAEPAVFDADRATERGMFTEQAPGSAAAKACGGAAFFGDDEIDRPIFTEGKNIVVFADIGISFGVLNIGAESANADDDRGSACRMDRDLARQCEQRQGPFQRYFGRRQIFR